MVFLISNRFVYTYYGDFPASCKSAIISPLIKKTGLDSEILKNYRGLLQTCHLFQKLLKKLLLPKYIVI